MWCVLREDARIGASHTQPLTLADTSFLMVSMAAKVSRLEAGMSPTTPLLQALNRSLCLFSVLTRGNSCLWMWVSALGSEGSDLEIQMIQQLRGQGPQGLRDKSFTLSSRSAWQMFSDTPHPLSFMMYSWSVSSKSTRLRYSNYFPVVWRPQGWKALISHLLKFQCALMSLF